MLHVSTMARFRSRIALVLGMLMLLPVLVACGSSSDSAGPTATPLPGTVFEPPIEVGDFTLTDHTGAPFSLSDLRGKVVMLFFGYTNCPDVCPTTLADFKRIKSLLGADADQVEFVFVSVDGARDTPERLAQYIQAFDPTFIGLTGEDAAIRQAGQAYGIFYQRVNYDNPNNYLVDHTASSFVIGANGLWRIKFSFDSDLAGMTTQLQRLLAEG